MDEHTLSRINLFAVLHTMEALPKLDPESRQIAERHSETIRFTVRGMGSARIAIGTGTITFLPGPGKSSIHLWFPNPRAFNAMIAGTGNPIPLKGLTKLAFLKGSFTTLTNRLSYFLKPEKALLKNKAYRDANVEMTLLVAGFSLSEIANHDETGKLNAARMPDGTVLIGIKGGPCVTVECKSKAFSTVSKNHPVARARMLFPDHDSAGAMLRGEVDAYQAIGSGGVELSGFVPLIDNLNKILGLVPGYLA